MDDNFNNMQDTDGNYETEPNTENENPAANMGYTVTPDSNYFENVDTTEATSNFAPENTEEKTSYRADNGVQFESDGTYHSGAIKPDADVPFDTENKFNADNSIPEFIEPPKNRKCGNFSFLTVVVAVVLATVIGALSGIVATKATLAKNTGTSASQSGENTEQKNVNITVDETSANAIEAVAEKVRPSVVGIRTTAAVISFFGGSSETTEEGSGIIYSSDGYIITNFHVIESALESAGNSSIEVYLPSDVKTPINATVVGYNISNDLAVIKINKTGLPKIEIADISSLKVGQYVAAVGNPGGLEYMGSVSYGIISGLNRTVTSSSSNETVNLIQTDAAINPGNSGGALVNIEGKLIGVNSSKIVAESFENMAFAIPVDTTVEICDKIIAKENDPDPYIGVSFSENWTADRLKEYGYPAGAVIKSTVSGGPADNAKIEKGDIITEFNGVIIEDYNVLNDEIAKCKPGQTVNVKIYRNGRYYSTTVKIGSNNSQ